MEEKDSSKRSGVSVVRRRRRKSAPKAVKRKVRKKSGQGIEGLIVTAIEALVVAKKLYSNIKPLIAKRAKARKAKTKTQNKKKETKKNGN